MIPAGPGGAVRLGGLILRDHWFDAPLDHARPDGEQIRIYAREVVAAEKAASGADSTLPWLLFLQGGPGGKATRPESASGWVGRAVRDFRVLLLDQRGTGRSTPATAATLATRGHALAQAEYLAHFRADSIVADAELVRRHLLGADARWSVLGQSYGGFCALTYLSFAPRGLAAAYLTGGLGPLGAGADEVYAATYARVEAKNAAFHQAFPQAREQLERIADHLRRHEVRFPDGSMFTVVRLQSLGMALGTRSALPGLAYLLEEAFVDGLHGAELSDTFLAGAWSRLSFATNPLYAVLHEPIYGQAEPTGWAAQRVRDSLPRFAPDATPLLLTGEMIYPWMFEADPALRPLRATADLLAERSWSPLYDLDALASCEVPVAAALYTDDMFVDADLSRRTAAAVRGLRVWETNAYEHDGLREADEVLDRLIRMARGEL
ncbi:MAG: alpha/beta fold hydrolase [Jiangellaceae bacterium]